MHSDNQTNDKAFDEACDFIIKLGEAAHGYGSNAGRLEVYLSRLTAALGFQGVFRSTPTEIVFAFQENENQAAANAPVGHARNRSRSEPAGPGG